jgi:Ice-binding-like/Bacterial Ig-like domain
VSYAGVTATFTPASALAPLTTFTATIITGARDLAGNALAANFVWSFTIAATPAGQAPVALGAATTFAVLAGSTVTNTGATTVNGDLGLSPGTAVTGFPPGTVNGTIYAGDPAAAQAQLDLTTAYNDATGRTVGAITVAGNLGGQTLTQASINPPPRWRSPPGTLRSTPRATPTRSSSFRWRPPSPRPPLAR